MARTYSPGKSDDVLDEFGRVGLYPRFTRRAFWALYEIQTTAIRADEAVITPDGAAPHAHQRMHTKDLSTRV